ncbi:MAG: SprB repeat-containing protein [Bacteroidota bacterium]|nr:MAG: SprB repeat-containing protein [Bacteroidota bacterium]
MRNTNRIVVGDGYRGTPPYTQLWSNGSTASFQNNQPLGTYSVTLTDSHGCIDTATAIILSPPTLTATTTNYISSCDSINTVPAATVTVNASGGVPPYMYLWSNGQTSQTISNLATGNYSVIVTDANGCTVQPVAQAYNNDAALIQGDTLICTGSQTTLSTVPGTSFSWSSSSGVISTAPTVNVAQGVYTLNMVNMAGCAHTGSFQVNEHVCNTILNLTCLLQGITITDKCNRYC